MACPYDALTKEQVDDYVAGLAGQVARLSADKGPVEACASVRTTRWVDTAHILVLLASVAVTAVLAVTDSGAGWSALEWLSLASTVLTLLHFRHALLVAGRLAWYGLGAIKFVLLITLVGAAATRALDASRAFPGFPRPLFLALLGVTVALTLVRLALLARSVENPDNESARVLALAAALNGVLSEGHIASLVAVIS